MQYPCTPAVNPGGPQLTWHLVRSAHTCRRCGWRVRSWSRRPRWCPAHAGHTGSLHALSGGSSSVQVWPLRSVGDLRGQRQPHRALARVQVPESRWAREAGRRAWRQCGPGRAGSRRGNRARSPTGRSWRAPGPRRARGGVGVIRDAGSRRPGSWAAHLSPVRRPRPGPIVVQGEPPGASQPQVSMPYSGTPCGGHQDVGPLQEARVKPRASLCQAGTKTCLHSRGLSLVSWPSSPCSLSWASGPQRLLCMQSPPTPAPRSLCPDPSARPTRASLRL